MCADSTIHTSIIIPTRNHTQMLARLIQGLYETADSFNANLELIIVDNNSDEQEALTYLDSLASSQPAPFANIRLIRFPHKFNYSAINNLAARHSQAEYLCFLNNDMEIIHVDWLNALHKPMAMNNTGCVGAMLYYPDNTIQHAGVYLDEKNVAGHLYKNEQRGATGHTNFLLSDQTVSAVTAACLLVRRDVFEQVNGFDEAFSVAFNDVDLCLRVQQAGYRNVWTPHAQLYHHESKSRGLKHQRSWLQKRHHKKEVSRMKRLWQSQLASEPHYDLHVVDDKSDSSAA